MTEQQEKTDLLLDLIAFMEGLSILKAQLMTVRMTVPFAANAPR